MGCTAITSLMSPYTAEEIQQELARVTPLLPVAELMNGGIIKLEGAEGLFNPNSLLDPSWLKGRMTLEEYVQAINYINQCAAQTHVGLNKIHSVSERPMRLNMKVQAGMAAVQTINERFKSIHITYQQTGQDMQINTSYQTDPVLRYAQRGKPPIAHATITMLYIVIN